MQSAQIQAVKELMDKQQSQVTSYSAIIIGVGYAGFFALWSLVKDYPYPKLHAVAGILIGVSLLFYVGWEIGHMIYRVLQLNSISHDFRETPPIDPLKALGDRLNAIDQRGFKVWPWALIPSVVTGLLGGGILLAIFVLELSRKLA
ncbi:MAG TPA: hypothetical protein VFR90_01505 [Methylibium sp.]|nr:hypothetical protein [Methylibium sp.]